MALTMMAYIVVLSMALSAPAYASDVGLPATNFGVSGMDAEGTMPTEPTHAPEDRASKGRKSHNFPPLIQLQKVPSLGVWATDPGELEKYFRSTRTERVEPKF